MDRDRLVQLYVFVAIIVLSLLVRIFLASYTLFIDAIYATMSTPVIYTMSYYSSQAYMEGNYVRRKKPEMSRLVTYETLALFASYVVGFFMFYALTGSTDYYVFTVAYIVSQTMRGLSYNIVNIMRALKLDPAYPFLVLMGGALVAVIHFVVIFFLFQL